MDKEFEKALTSAITNALTPIVDAVVKMKTLELQQKQAETKKMELETLDTESQKLQEAVRQWVSYQTEQNHPLKGKDLVQNPETVKCDNN